MTHEGISNQYNEARENDPTLKLLDFLNADERNYERAKQMLEANISKISDDTLVKVHDAIRDYESVETEAANTENIRLKRTGKWALAGLILGTLTSSSVVLVPGLAATAYVTSDKPKRPYDRKKMDAFMKTVIDTVDRESLRRRDRSNL